MSTQISIAQMLAELESQIAHRKQEEHHAQQEVLHHEQRAAHAARCRRPRSASRRFAPRPRRGKLVERRRAATAPPSPGDEPFPDGVRRPVSRLVARVVRSRRPEDVFGATAIAQEINLRYGPKLDRLMDSRTVSVTLRRPSRQRPAPHRPLGLGPPGSPLLLDGSGTKALARSPTSNRRGCLPGSAGVLAGPRYPAGYRCRRDAGAPREKSGSFVQICQQRARGGAAPRPAARRARQGAVELQ